MPLDRNKKIATKSLMLKRPSPQQPVVNGSDNLSSTRSTEEGNSTVSTERAPGSYFKKKIAAKSCMLSPTPQPVINDSDALSSAESFKSIANAESFSEIVNNGDNHDTNNDTEETIAPARLVASLSVTPPAAVAVKKVKSRQKRPPKKKTNKIKQPKDGYWEVDRILDVRKIDDSSSYEFLVKWTGDWDDTWEPQDLLNEKALQEAKELLKQRLQQQVGQGDAALSVSNEDEQDLNESGEVFA